MDRSARLMARATHRLPGGVNSPVRAFRSVGGDPVFMRRGEGSRIFDVDGNPYVDYVMSYGPLILPRSPRRGGSPEEHSPGGDDVRGAEGARGQACRARLRVCAFDGDGPDNQL